MVRKILIIGLFLLAFSLSGLSCTAAPQATSTPSAAPASINVPEPSPTAPPAPPAVIAPVPSPGIILSQPLPPVIQVTQKARPSVVSIAVKSTTLDYFFRPVPEEANGSGVIVDKQGHIVTNNHVVEGARQLTVRLDDGRSFAARVVGIDPDSDLAVIKIDGENLPVAAMGDSDKLQVGEWVVAIGNALNLPGGPTVTVGVVGALGRTITTDGAPLHDLIQTDAAINPGNSGGALVSLNGEVVGINTTIIRGAQGIGFAISINSARPIIEDLIKRGYIIRLGISTLPVTPSIAEELSLSRQEGLLITNVVRFGSAQRAGIRPGDIIVKLDGQPIASAKQLQEGLRKHEIGDKVPVTIVRDGAEQTIAITLLQPTPRR